MIRPRFGLRTLLVLTALVAAGCYWWIARPTMVAERFRAAIERGDFAAAKEMAADLDALLSFDTTRAVFESLRPARKSDTIIGAGVVDGFAPALEVELVARSWRDIWRRQRRLVLWPRHDHQTFSIVFDRRPEPWAMLLLARDGRIELQYRRRDKEDWPTPPKGAL